MYGLKLSACLASNKGLGGAGESGNLKVGHEKRGWKRRTHMQRFKRDEENESLNSQKTQQLENSFLKK